MTYPRATELTAAVRDRLALIRPENGYRTHVGRAVHVGLSDGTPTDVPCTYLVPGRELGAKKYGVSQRERTYNISCRINRHETAIDDYPDDPKAAWVIVDAVAGDVCSAMESPGAFDSALVESLALESVEPAYVEGSGELLGVNFTYSITYATTKGDPDTPPA